MPALFVRWSKMHPPGGEREAMVFCHPLLIEQSKMIRAFQWIGVICWLPIYHYMEEYIFCIAGIDVNLRNEVNVQPLVLAVLSPGKISRLAAP